MKSFVFCSHKQCKTNSRLCYLIKVFQDAHFQAKSPVSTALVQLLDQWEEKPSAVGRKLCVKTVLFPFSSCHINMSREYKV